MIPWVVSRELRATLLDYLRSTWSLADRAFEAALFDFLSGPRGIFQGPYLRLGLPFAPCPEGAAIPIDVAPPYAPHLHQLQAWQRLSSKAQQPRATLVTTGTGSGKTECFLYPILDHVLRENAAGRGGIKAIILYPMNALAADQAGRFADAVWKDERLQGRVRVGLFVGGKGQHRDMGRDHVVDDNDRLRDDPPDILLTNYRMLDLLLQRPKDARLWRNNGDGSLRYLVLDELHTYDGAQGTDVACLIRRLGQRLGSAESICPVGTSATIGSGEQTRAALLAFASKLFDQELSDDAFVGETRAEPRDLLRGEPLPEAVPAVAGPWPEPGESADAHVRAAVRAWLPSKAATEILEIAAGGIDRVALGRWALRLPIVRRILALTHSRPRPAKELVDHLAEELAAFRAGSAAQRQGWLASALSLISFAQRDVGGHALPLVSVQATLWVREVRRLLARVGGSPAFRFHDDDPAPEGEAWLPRYACSDCGQGGWLITESGPGDALGLSYKEIVKAHQQRSPDLRLLHDDASVETDEMPRVAWLDARVRRLLDKQSDDGADATGAPLQPRVRVFSLDGDKLRCPGCSGVRTVRLLAARSTTLSSVAVGHLFTTPLNTDRKLLAFSDSVQDAAHRAGFFGARTYRFALRTAILAAVPREGRVLLADLGDATWDHWVSRPSGKPGLSPVSRFAAVVLPVDLHFLSTVVEWHDRLEDFSRRRREASEAGEAVPTEVPEPSPALVADLKQRLRWECTRELGVASRIGRTLEQTGCASVTVRDDRFDPAARAVDALLREKLGLSVAPGLAATRACLAGLLTRLRLRGGIDDPLLAAYVKSGGDGFALSKRMSPLLSPFTKETTRPILLSNGAKPKRFDPIAAPRATTWMVDWLTRSLGVAPEPGTATEVYASILPILVQHGILVVRPTEEKSVFAGKKASAWALAPDALEVSRDHIVRRCAACGHDQAAVRGSATDPVGGPCLRFRCAGIYDALADAQESTAETLASDGLPSPAYYRRFYERRELGRLWSKEHTGILARGPREELELEFKQSPRPDSPNLLSCTPTLEMGIDIGDLSATLLCSVPPDASSYVQRVGRAGRKTGNALVLAFAATRPHDLYFFDEPMEAMAGVIHPPGCYLSAPEVLRRQALAFCFDHFARDGGKLGGRLGDVLKGEGSSKPFPKPLVEFIAERRDRLGQAFTEMFGKNALTPSATAAVRGFFAPEADGRSPLEATLERVTTEARGRRDDLRRLAQKLDERLKQLDTDEVEAKKVPDLDEEKGRLRDERGFVLQQMKTLREAELWGWLAEESCLPNYAFPERGVKLDAFIRREGIGQEPEHHSWVRAPSSALRELAPFNTFYASARRVIIDGVSLKREAQPTTWRFCRSCHHTERLVGASPTATPTEEATCPGCGDARWADVGQARQVLTLTEVFAVARHRDAVLGDDTEDRDKAYYESIALFEPGTQARDAWANDAAGFGFELQPQMTLRELNLGPKDGGEKTQKVDIGGQRVSDVRFLVCATCGQAKSPRKPTENERPREAHRAWCPERKKPEDKQPRRELHLLRELRSEAIRMVVPVADGEDSAAQLANLRAGLRLGLRRFYGGDPDFLDVRSYDEPLPGREGRRRFLVILDRVPGGTGLLAELCKDTGAKLKSALELAHDTLRTCVCQTREPAAKACYQCLYAYRAGEELPLLERSVALGVMERLIEAFAALVRVDSVGSMTQSSVLESELEHRFLAKLQKQVLATSGNTFAATTDGTWKLQVGARSWLLRAQVELGADRVAVPCRADFVLYPDQAGALPIAVFTDGLAYHVTPGEPRARLADDARKRGGVSQGGGMLTWSMTWKDVVCPLDPPVPRWTGDGTAATAIQGLAHKVDGTAPAKERLAQLLPVLDGDPFGGLVAMLEAPSRLHELARLTAFVLLQRGRRQPASRVAEAHAAWRTTAEPAVLPLTESEGDTATTMLDMGGHARLLLDMDSARLNGLLRDASHLHATLRLEDEQERRQRPDFEANWRLWLRAWNLLQALTGATLVTRDGATEAGGAGTSVPPAPAEAVADGASDDPRMAAANEIGDAAARAAVRELLARHRGLQAPKVPLELRPELEGDIELGWPEHRVGAYFERQTKDAETLRERGWTMLPIERKLDVATLEAALGLLPEGSR